MGTVKSIRDVAEAVEHLVEGAVTPRGDHDLEALLDGISREPARIPGGGSELESAVRSNIVEVTAEVPGFVASGRWIEDDARPHTPLFGPPGTDSRAERLLDRGLRNAVADSTCTAALEVRAVLLYTLRQ